ncbi:hypothetical protein [uncultured Cohaesibacter sp.]|uniref:hypothetical protein n=1 Tax=uncultured Cohaesibacter sp. TaxID=1002546 RepID=UPI0029C662CF|nr:hypothetical protein [uncultured Cohaesibacter sp.]
MRIYVFVASKGASFGFSSHERGEHLPLEHGPWLPFKSIDVTRRSERNTGEIAGMHRFGVDVAEMIEGIDREGYFVLH